MFLSMLFANDVACHFVVYDIPEPERLPVVLKVRTFKTKVHQSILFPTSLACFISNRGFPYLTSLSLKNELFVRTGSAPVSLLDSARDSHPPLI